MSEAPHMSMSDLDNSTDRHAYAAKVADASYDWYKSNAAGSRRMYKASEIIVILSAAAIPVSVALWPDVIALPAVLGGVVAVTSGLRPVFHWQANYLRFSEARESVDRERRLYHLKVDSYADEATRQEHLIKAISAIEQSEMGGWLKIAAKRPGNE